MLTKSVLFNKDVHHFKPAVADSQKTRGTMLNMDTRLGNEDYFAVKYMS